MIAILPLREMSILTELNAKENTSAHHAFCLYESNQMQGYILYSITNGQGEFLAANATDDTMLDGLIRAVLASLLDADIDTANFSDRFDLPTLRELKIISETEEKVTSIHNLFYNCNGCQNCGAK